LSPELVCALHLVQWREQHPTPTFVNPSVLSSNHSVDQGCSCLITRLRSGAPLGIWATVLPSVSVTMSGADTVRGNSSLGFSVMGNVTRYVGDHPGFFFLLGGNWCDSMPLSNFANKASFITSCVGAVHSLVPLAVLGNRSNDV
jgi:hypothetical protein